MGFFDSAKSHVDLLEKDCRLVGELSSRLREKCEQSVRGKYDYAPAGDRAELVRAAQDLLVKLHETHASAKERQRVMEGDQCPSQELMAAQTLLLAAGLDVTKAEKALAEARASLLTGIAEIEAFYGERSREAKEFRRVLSENGISA